MPCSKRNHGCKFNMGILVSFFLSRAKHIKTASDGLPKTERVLDESIKRENKMQ